MDSHWQIPLRYWRFTRRPWERRLSVRAAMHFRFKILVLMRSSMKTSHPRKWNKCWAPWLKTELVLKLLAKFGVVKPCWFWRCTLRVTKTWPCFPVCVWYIIYTVYYITNMFTTILNHNIPIISPWKQFICHSFSSFPWLLGVMGRPPTMACHPAWCQAAWPNVCRSPSRHLRTEPLSFLDPLAVSLVDW